MENNLMNEFKELHEEFANSGRPSAEKIVEEACQCDHLQEDYLKQCLDEAGRQLDIMEQTCERYKKALEDIVKIKHGVAVKIAKKALK